MDSVTGLQFALVRQCPHQNTLLIEPIFGFKLNGTCSVSKTFLKPTGPWWRTTGGGPTSDLQGCPSEGGSGTRKAHSEGGSRTKDRYQTPETLNEGESWIATIQGSIGPQTRVLSI